jgi:hypothetical protein
MLTLMILGVPIAYLIAVVVLLIRKEPRGLELSLLFAVISVMTGIWAINQSRSSTAGIAFLGLPLMGALGGFLGLVFGRYRLSAEPSHRFGAWVGLVGALSLVAFNITSGEQERSKNHRRDDTQAVFSAEIGRDRDTISTALKENPGRERAWLDSSIRTRMNDRAFLLAALPNDSISPETLDTFANSPDMGLMLEAVSNPNASAETLQRVYRRDLYYTFQALAANHHTPPSVLLDLYRRPGIHLQFDIWFAGNPATPREVLDEISRTSSDRSIIGALLENPSLDCGLLTQVGVSLMKRQKRDADDPNVMRVSELLPKVCQNQPAR